MGHTIQVCTLLNLSTYYHVLSNLPLRSLICGEGSTSAAKRPCYSSGQPIVEVTV